MLNRLKEIRKNKGYSQFDIANKLGYNQTLVSKWEKGKCDPGTEALLRLSELYGVSIDYLLDNERFIEQTKMDLIEIPDEKKEAVEQLLELPESMFIYIAGQIKAYYQVSKMQ